MNYEVRHVMILCEADTSADTDITNCSGSRNKVNVARFVDGV